MSNSIAIGVAYADQDIANASKLQANILTGVIGYNTGSTNTAIPTVTQGTSKSTGVTLSAAAGKVTMNNAALASATAVSFTLTNNQIGLNDIVLVNVAGGIATGGTYSCRCLNVAAGSAVIELTNISGGSLSEAVVLSYATIQLTAA
jgi:hypothetical protein